jgi:outer membrane protein assembly factor BamB
VIRAPSRLALAWAVLLALVCASPASADWPRYGGDDLLTNNVPKERAGGISSTTVPRIAGRWNVKLTGRIVASPLYANGVTMGLDVENVVFVATNTGTVAAIRAEDGTILWQRNVSATVTTCGSTYGISSSPILDRGRNRLYVIGADGLLYALDLSTGATKPGWPVRVVGATRAEYAWGGLATFGTRVYVPVASYCDKADEDGFLAEGRLVAVDVVDARIVAGFDPVAGPNNMGGMWGYAGTSIDPATGHLWTATGNSWVYDPECGCTVEDVGYAESVVELDRDLNVLASNRPAEIPFVEDNDFGAAPLLFQPPGCPPLAAANAKNGRVYIWNRNGLGAGPIWNARVGPDNLGSAFIGQPSYSPGLNMFFVSDARDYDLEGAIRTFDAVVGFAVGPGCALPERPTWTAPGVGRGPKTPPLVVGDVVFVPGGFDHNAFALDARTGKTLWTVGLPGAVLAPIAFADDSVLVADATGNVYSFGLPRPAGGAGGRGRFAI